MTPKIYHFLDKTSWGDGEWLHEPDKAQWQDPTTGLPCLIVRGPQNAWCGYAGVEESHPWFGKRWDKCLDGCPEGDEDHWCDWEQSPQGKLEAHGGVNFSAFCADTSEAAWHRARQYAEAFRDNSGQVSDRWYARYGKYTDTHEQFIRRVEVAGICHIPDEGESDHVWWFGFDCGHSGDICPGHKAVSASYVYRSERYTRDQVTALAAQLHAIQEKGTTHV